MRLTLRTLLAYRDRVLKAQDYEALHHRIQQSDGIGNLLKRIHLLTSSSQLPSTELENKQADADANTVAEYLDDVLASSSVPEFERSCLESNAQLAELAHCHQLLATAMQTKVTVPEDLRALAQRIAVPDQRALVIEGLRTRAKHKQKQLVSAEGDTVLEATAEDATQSSSVSVKVPMLESQGASIRPEGLNLEATSLTHEVPEYLRGANRSTFLLPAAIVTLAALLGILIWQAAGPLDKVVALYTASDADSSSQASNENKPPITPKERVSQGSGDDSTRPDSTRTGDTRNDSESPAQAPSTKFSNESAEPTPKEPERANGDTATDEANSDKAGLPDPSESVVTERPATSSSVDATASMDTPEVVKNDDIAQDTLADVLISAAPGHNALMATNSPTGWQVLGDSAAVPVGQPLVQFPRLRSILNLNNGQKLEVCGAAKFSLAQSLEGFELLADYCQALLHGKQGQMVTIQMANRKWKIQITSDSAVVAIDCGPRWQTSGSILDPATTTPSTILIVGDGKATVSDSLDAKAELQIGEGIAWLADQKSRNFKMKQIPAWFRSSAPRPVDKLASSELGQFVVGASDLKEALAELSRSPRPETSALAIQSSMLLGDWKPFAEGCLQDSNKRGYWFDCLELARFAIAAEPALAPELRSALAATLPAGTHDRAFELLCGLPLDTINQESLNQMINDLEHPQLAIRVLSHFQLQSLSSLNLGYLPYRPQRAAVQSWRKELLRDRLPIELKREPIWEAEISRRE